MAITEGLPAAGSDIGGFMGGIAPGAGALILTVGVAKGVSDITGSVAKRVAKEGKKKNKSRSKKSTKKPRRKSLTRKRQTYNTPLIPKMGPF